jgi:hypothetical protein
MPRSFPLAVAAAVALVAGVFPTVMFGDDGELIRAVWGLGAAHPPGIPAFLLLSKPLTLLPLGSIAMRAHLATIVAAVAAVMLVRLLALSWGSGNHGAHLAAAAFLAMPIAWQQSRLARAYPFLAAATLLIILLATRLDDEGRGDRRLPALLLFICGLGMTLHQLMLIPTAAVAALLLWRRAPGTVAALPLAAVGAIPFAALPLRSAAAAEPVGWGSPSTLRTLLDHLLQTEYAAKVGDSGSTVLSQAGTIVGSLPRELTWPLLALSALGLVVLARRRPAAAALFLVIAAGTMALRALYGGETGPDAYRVIVRYLLGPLALFCALAGVGWGILLRFAGERDRFSTGSLSTLLTILAVGTIAMRPAATFRAETPWLWHDQARGTLLSAPPRGIVLVGGDDILFPIWYLQGLGGYTPDRLAISVDGFGRSWYREETASAAAHAVGLPQRTVRDADTALELVTAANVPGASVAAAMIPPGSTAAQQPLLTGPDGPWVAHGLTYRLLPDLPLPGRGAGVWRAIPVRQPTLPAPIESREPFSQIAWFLTVAARDAVAAGRPAAALPLLFRAVALDPADAVVHNDTGLTLMALGLRGDAAESFRSALRLLPGDAAIRRNLALAQSPPGSGEPHKEELR